jgi:hypothetical protein
MKTTHWLRNSLIGVVLVFLVAACSGPPPAPNATAAPATSTTRPTPVATQTTAPTATPTPLPTATPTPTSTLNPLTIQSMRERSYPGSAVTIEQTLQPGSNYSRYIASYQSARNRRPAGR